MVNVPSTIYSLKMWTRQFAIFTDTIGVQTNKLIFFDGDCNLKRIAFIYPDGANIMSKAN